MLALIDGDVLAHHSCKSRWAKKAAPGMLYDSLVQMTEDKDSVTFSKQDDADYLEQSWINFQHMLANILEEVYADDYLMAVKSDVNFRDLIYPLEFIPDVERPVSGYKANRWKSPAKHNIFVPSIRTLACMEEIAIEAHGREADDLLRIWARQAEEAGDDYVIVSIDKDLKCIHGAHYNISSHKTTYVTKHEALRFYYQQLISGDSTDNIPGVIGLGPVKAERLLFNTTDEEEMQEIVVQAYMSAYEDDWYNMLLSNGKLLYLQEHAEDYFMCSHWPVVKAMLEIQAAPPVIEAKVVAPTPKLQIVSPVPKVFVGGFMGSVPPLKGKNAK
jgi:hypothetical protein